MDGAPSSPVIGEPEQDVEDEKVQLQDGAVELEVKVEPGDDDDGEDHHFHKIDDSLDEMEMHSMWSFLVKRSRHKYLNNHGRRMDCAKITQVLLKEVEELLRDVSDFIQECSTSWEAGESDRNDSNVIALDEKLALSLIGQKMAQVEINSMRQMPSQYQDSLFSSLGKRKRHPDPESMEVKPRLRVHPISYDETEIPDTFLQEEDEDEDYKPTILNTSGCSDNIEAKFSQFPKPKIVPVDYNRKKQICVCEDCGGSWSRKEYYYHHKSVGKCSPKWIRYSAKNKNRIRCVHPDCESKRDVSFTYAGIMKHIIDLHTSQESSALQCPECPLKFPMKAVLKFHQDSAHQAHAMICTICGKIVRDMRKHKLVHSAEKPFQCDRCSYRCSRSGTLKRHMATHLNSSSRTNNRANSNSNANPETTETSSLLQRPASIILPPVQKFEDQQNLAQPQSVPPPQPPSQEPVLPTQQQQQPFSDHPLSSGFS